MDRSMEGKLYKSINVADKIFDVFYGYNSDEERKMWGPAPIFPDFLKDPLYTAEGQPFARADQDICGNYTPKDKVSGENWCNDCIYFRKGDDIIGICISDKRLCIVRKNE